MIFTARSNGQFSLGDKIVPCALGKSGLIAGGEKREGDGASPIGVWPIRRFLYRPDRLSPPSTALCLSAINPADGWCDAPDDIHYNQLVHLPYPASCETLWRDDAVYDLIGILGHNDDPPVAAMGSAIFLHLARPGYLPTEGCVALGLDDMLAVMAMASSDSAVEIKL